MGLGLILRAENASMFDGTGRQMSLRLGGDH
jgi:hypothetical protein